jgi:2-oxoglutarate ferredoxin oxidoreductase subunit alpha
MDYSIRITGAAGQGIQTIGGTLAKVFARSGYHVFTHQDYESRVRGGHNYYQIRFSDTPVMSSRDAIDILVAMDSAGIDRYINSLTENGLVIYDSKALKQDHEGTNFLDIPFMDLAVEHGGSRIMANTVATGAVLGLIGMEADILIESLKRAFSKKGDKIVNENIAAANAGHSYAAENYPKGSFVTTNISEPMMLITGNDAIALGAIASGLKFYSAYPMTPSTSIMNYIAGKEEEYGILVEQAEDEIAAINMALGASFAGVRAMTGTSGGGFALMVEGISLAGITEIPIVIALAQRPGPATGLPTRTEQGDLEFALYSAHGEFPRIILAPGTPEQAFHLTNRAFEMAEKYQVPVIILTDQYLADSQWTFDKFDTARLQYTDRRLKGKALTEQAEYNRYTYTGTGVSPMALPGESRHLVVTDSDEHDEEGHMIEDAETRIKMVDKRLFKKLPAITKDISPPAFYGSDKPKIVIAGWGSTYGLLKEAVDALSDKMNISMLHFSEIYPLPESEEFDYLQILRDAEVTICIEGNATSQFARLMKIWTDFSFSSNINKYDGRPFTLESLIGEINAIAG